MLKIVREKTVLTTLELNEKPYRIIDLSNDKDKVFDFLSKNSDNNLNLFTKAYGLVVNEGLIAVTTLSSPISNKNYQWEIMSFSHNRNCEIDDAFSILFNYFINENKVHSCIYHTNTPIKGANNIGLKLLTENKSLYEYSYFPFSVVYKTTDLNTGHFYIGKCEIEDKFINGYLGSGTLFLRHLEKYSGEHEFKREILKENFNTPEELYCCEAEEIQKNFDYDPNKDIWVKNNELCLNLTAKQQSPRNICLECGGYLTHKSWCSKNHRSGCPECGSLTNHKLWCSHHKNIICAECGGKQGRHRKGCSKYVALRGCSECGAAAGHHNPGCSQYEERYSVKVCPECRCKLGKHNKSCSQYKPSNVKRCDECGNPTNAHKSSCSHYSPGKVCPECGGKRGIHKKTCSKYKAPEPCPECGSKSRTHRVFCSKYVKPANCCEFCGTPPGGKHKKDCPLFKPVICPECGYRANRHSKDCSRNRRNR